MKCPACGLYSPDGATRCDCGYNFAWQPGSAADQTFVAGRRAAANRNMRHGAAWVVAGLAMLALTYAYALDRGGGNRIFGLGPVIFGLVQFFRGVAQRWPRKD
jgi:hypothetical protein